VTLKTKTPVDIWFHNEMIVDTNQPNLKPHALHILAEARRLYADTEEIDNDDLRLVYAVGGMYGLWAPPILSAPSGLDHLQQDAFWEGVKEGERHLDGECLCITG
jgi:hypothetical protein